MLLNLFIPGAYFPVLLSTFIWNRFQVKPATLLIPINLFLFLCGEGVLRYPVLKWLLSLFNVGVDFTARVGIFSLHSQ